jgi:NhaP-type Na+/H+ or K+/H+ antiporter
MFDLQSRGYGVAQGIPSLVVAAASFDDVVAISGFSMFIGLAIGNGNIILEALHGPINIIAGGVCGAGGAYLLCLTKLWDTDHKRSAVILLLGLIFTFSSKFLHFAGAGALASLVMAAGAAQLWSRGAGGSLSSGPDDMMAHHVEEILCNIWRVFAEPLLFSVIGSALDFSRIDVSTIPKAIGLVLGGVVVRCLAAMFATFGAGLSLRERLFIALAWMPKATVQAALGSVPLSLVRDGLKREDDPAKFDRYEQWGIDILTTAVFSILLTAPVGLIVIQQFGPRWLEYSPPTTASSGSGKLQPVMPTVTEVSSACHMEDVDEDDADDEAQVVDVGGDAAKQTGT